MDSVLGKRGKSKNTLLVLTERKTRNEIIFKLPDHTDEAVVAALDRLERKWGADMFKRVFKTITVDNGSEFADAEGFLIRDSKNGNTRKKDGSAMSCVCQSRQRLVKLWMEAA